MSDHDIGQPEFETIERGRGKRITEAVLAVILLVLVVAIVGYCLRDGYQPDDVEVLMLVVPVGALAAFGIYRAKWGRTMVRPTQYGLAKQAAEKARRDEEFEKWFDRWWIRYPAAIALLVALWWIVAEVDIDSRKHSWIVWGGILVLVVKALWWMREVSKYLLILLGICLAIWGAFGLIEGARNMSPSSAIIVGACIIAYAIYATRKPG